MKVKIWVLSDGKMSFWKEHGKRAWSRDIVALINTIKNGYEVKYCDNENSSEVEWK